MNIVFLVASAGLSGGNYVIFQHALYAQQQGHSVTIATLFDEAHYDNAWHPAVPLLRMRHIERIADETFDIAFATFWLTAVELHRIRARQYAYFVQSIESRFFPESQPGMRNMIDTVYGWNLPGFTEATWIQQYLAEHYGSHYRLVLNGIRKDLYTEDGPRVAARGTDRMRILVEGPFGSIKNTARALATTRRARAGEVWLLTTSDIPWYPGVQRVFRNLPVEQVPTLYRSCDLLVKLSLVEGMFGPPLEMFHCGGTAVVYDVTGHDEYIRHDHNSLVARTHDEAGVIEAIRRLRDDPALLARLKAGARSTAADWPDWDRSSAAFVECLDELHSAEPVSRERLVALTRQLRADFPEETRCVDVPAQRGAATPSATMRNAVRRYRTLWHHIAAGYR